MRRYPQRERVADRPGDLPAGLISGTPSAAGGYGVTVTATDSTGAGSVFFAWTVSASVGSCSGQKLSNPGFELGTTGWAQTNGVINTDGAHPRAGAGYAWLDGYGSTHTDTLSQTVTVPANCHAVLSYYLYVNSSETTTTAFDKIAVTVNGTIVQSFSNVNKGSAYLQRTVSLDSYAGRAVTLKWTGTENSSRQTSFFIEDTAVTLS